MNLKRFSILILGLMAACVNLSAAKSVSLYRIFELRLENDQAYANKFADVDLTATFQSPSGESTRFMGFFDGNGDGTGDATHGTVLKIRFMPAETGEWTYEYQWSDGTPGGKGTFTATEEGAGKGILKAYEGNPRWLAYNGTEPVWLKSYYETGHGSIAQDFDWIVDNVYQPLIDHGYNHVQVNWLLSLCCFGQYYLDGPEPETQDLLLYQEGKASSTMNLDTWRRMEKHLGWFNDRDVGVHMFLGFDGARNESVDWTKLSDEEKDFYVRYVVARLAPFASIAGWNFVWEVDGTDEERELQLARLLMKYDVFEHLRAYEDEFPRENVYEYPEYTFAAVENHGLFAADKKDERIYWRSAFSHHMACLLGYKGKPVYMSEGNALWRRFWHPMVGANQEDLRRAAWACVTAGASFNWNGHAKEYELYAGGPEGLPFNDENPFRLSEGYIQILTDIMNKEVVFQDMNPADALLSRHQVLDVYALAEPGSQYLVFSMDGKPFDLALEPGVYEAVTWIDSKTGERQSFGQITIPAEGEAVPFEFDPPSTDTDWVLVVK